MAKSGYKQYDECESFTNYAKTLLTTFFNNRNQTYFIELRLARIKEKHDYLWRLFFHKNMDWIRMDVFNHIFPDITLIALYEVDLCAEIFEDILRNYSNVNVEIIEIYITNEDGFAMDLVEKYKDKFRQELNVFITFKHLLNDCLKISPEDPDPQKLAEALIAAMNFNPADFGMKQ